MLIYLQMLESPEEKSILEQIYLEYRGLMYHVAYEILHNEQDAEDAVHHAFVKIAENIKKITDPVCPKTHSYVVTIVEHQAIDQYKKGDRVLLIRTIQLTADLTVTCPVTFLMLPDIQFITKPFALRTAWEDDRSSAVLCFRSCSKAESVLSLLYSHE